MPEHQEKCSNRYSGGSRVDESGTFRSAIIRFRT